MYCASCGAEVSEGMSYCNRCGAKLKPVSEEVAVVSPSQPPARVSAGAAWAMAAAVALITIVGFGIAFSLVMVFVERGLSLDEGRLAVVIMTLVSVLLIDWLLLRQFTRLTSGKAQAADDAPAKPEKRKLSEKAPPQLAAPREPVPSVTEHTTRTFDTVYRERETKP
ncbi:MAG TPA: zinc ribbon domain-containing protein [Pyrinomonadaceae bacterium]